MVPRDAIMPVPGAFELPIAAMALAKTRRYACIVALGCIIRGDTPHFDFVAGEAASGLQLAALETGVPVAFGVLTLEDADQADDWSKGARPSAPGSRWPTSSRKPLGRRTALTTGRVGFPTGEPAPPRLARGQRSAFSAAIMRRRVQGLRIVRQEAVVREQPEPLDGGDPASLQPEPPARPGAAERRRQAGRHVCTKCLKAGKVQKAVDSRCTDWPARPQRGGDLVFQKHKPFGPAQSGRSSAPNSRLCF